MKKHWLIIGILLCLPLVSFGANIDVSFSGSPIITVISENFTITQGNLDSITVNAGNFTVDLSRDAKMTITSANKRLFTVSPAEYTDSFVCGSSESTLSLNNDIWDTTVTVTVTPTSGSTCSGGGGGGGSSGGGGGGGGGGSSGGGGGGGGGGGVPTPVYTVIPGTTSVPATTVAQPSAVAISVSPVFLSAMKIGESSPDIKRLQQLLNSDPDTLISSSGVGSPGNETNYFGSLTEKAVQKFQKKYSIAKEGDTGFGYVGPLTRGKLAEVFITGVPASTPVAPSVATPSSVAVSVSPVFSGTLSRGKSNSDIKRLQQLLNSDPDTQISSSGVGSPGNETEYYGLLTEEAVKKFQTKYGIVSSGSPETTGYGLVGPSTRAKIQEVFSNQETPAIPEAPITPAAPAETGEQAQIDVLQSQIDSMLSQLQALQADLQAQLTQ